MCKFPLIPPLKKVEKLIPLTCDAPIGTGKTTARADTSTASSWRLVPNEQVVEVIEFEATDAADS